MLKIWINSVNLTMLKKINRFNGVKVVFSVAKKKKGKEMCDVDPYLWLEDIDGEKALAWAQKQNQQTVDYFQQHYRYTYLGRLKFFQGFLLLKLKVQKVLKV